ncbi:MAG: hypothetical protein MZV49_18930 [Rhodopseudomonas palustris]|nr:hypothetical protein [Rhodopseudomonas palustris]
MISVYSPKTTHDAPVPVEPCHHQHPRPDQEHARRRRSPCCGARRTAAVRAWVKTDRLTGLNLTTGDIINAIQGQNMQAAVGRIGARPISNDNQLQLNISTRGGLQRDPRL